MLPFPIISKTTIVPSENTIITLLKTCGTLTMTLGFLNHSNPFTVGDSTDNAYPFNGYIDSFNITMTT